jgi:hypothetical protein
VQLHQSSIGTVTYVGQLYTTWSLLGTLYLFKILINLFLILLFSATVTADMYDFYLYSRGAFDVIASGYTGFEFVTPDIVHLTDYRLGSGTVISAGTSYFSLFPLFSSFVCTNLMS